MTPRPARRFAPGRNVRPARVTDTDLRHSSMGQMHRDHAWGGFPGCGWKWPTQSSASDGAFRRQARRRDVSGPGVVHRLWQADSEITCKENRARTFTDNEIDRVTVIPHPKNKLTRSGISRLERKSGYLIARITVSHRRKK